MFRQYRVAVRSLLDKRLTDCQNQDEEAQMLQSERDQSSVNHPKDADQNQKIPQQSVPAQPSTNQMLRSEVVKQMRSLLDSAKKR